MPSRPKHHSRPASSNASAAVYWNGETPNCPSAVRNSARESPEILAARFLSESPQLVPFHGGGQAQLPPKILRVHAKRGQSLLRHVAL